MTQKLNNLFPKTLQHDKFYTTSGNKIFFAQINPSSKFFTQSDCDINKTDIHSQFGQIFSDIKTDSNFIGFFAAE